MRLEGHLEWCNNMQVIGIVGLDYCGSTVISNVSLDYPVLSMLVKAIGLSIGNWLQRMWYKIMSSFYQQTSF